MKKRNWKERFCALALAVILPFTNMMPGIAMTATAAGPDTGATVRMTVKEEIPVTAADGTVSMQKIPVVGAMVKIYAEGEESAPLLSAETDEQGRAYVVENETTQITEIPVMYDSSKTYYYSVEKAGYVMYDSKNETAGGAVEWDQFDVAEYALESVLAMDAIQLKDEAAAGSVTLDLSQSQNTAQLTIANDIGNGYTWTSSDEAVATVDAVGLVTAHKAGKTTITVARADQTASVDVAVYNTIGMSITVNPGSNETKPVLDKTEVIISVGNMPANAKGIVTICKGTNEIGTITAPYTSTVTYKDPEGIKGTTTFEAVYTPAEGEYYKETKASTEGISYKKTLDLKLNVPAEGLHVTYGQTEPITITANDDTGRTLHFALAKNAAQGVLNIENDQMTIIGAGTTAVQVTAEASDQYAMAEATVDIIVDPKPVTITASSIKWDAAQKVYDGSDSIGLVGRIAIEKGVELEITVTAELKSKAAGSYQEATVTRIDEWQSKYSNYKFTWGNSDKAKPDELKVGSSITGLNVVVTKRPLYIQMQDAAEKVEYSKVTTQIDEAIAKYKATPLGGTGKNNEVVEGEDTNLQGVVAGEETTVEKMLAGATEIVQTTDAVETPITNASYVGKYDKALKLQMKKDANTGNYEVYIKPGTEYGSVTISQEKISDTDAWSLVQVQKVKYGDKGETLYELPYTEGETIWLTADMLVKFSPVNTRYTDAFVYVNEEKKYQSVLSFTEQKNTKEPVNVTNAFYLSNSNDVDTRTTKEGTEADTDNRIPSGKIMLDDVNPVVKFPENEVEKNMLQDLYSAEYKFGNFVEFINKATTKEILASDVGSGLADVAYTLVPVTKANSEKLKNTVTTAATDPNTSWTEVVCTAGGKGSIPIPADKNVYYLALVKATDNVGNQVVYASNGIVVDIVKPTVKATIITEKETEQFAGDVNYTIEVTDPADAGSTSGIDKIVVQVCASGAEITGGKIEEENVYTNSFTLDHAALNELKSIRSNAGYTFEELETKSEYTISGRILAETCNSNEVTLTVTAYDQAGNMASADTIKLAIDRVAPEITGISYDKTEEDNVYPDRTMTITYKERNFDPALATFEIAEDDGSQTAEKTVTLQDILDGKAAGLTAKEVSEKPEVLTDDTQVIYAITFGPQTGKDITYTVKPSVKDKAGNVGTIAEGITAEQVFTIDNKVPVVSVQYDNNDVKNEKYFNKERMMTITYTERNFDANLVTFDVMVNGGETKTVKLAELADTQSVIKAGTVTAGTKANGYQHTYQFTFGQEKEDVDYTIVPHITDQADNVNAEIAYAEGTKAGETFTVDMVAPVMNVTYYAVNLQQVREDVTASIGTKVQNSMYHNNTIEANVTITERNFSAVGAKVIETAKDVNGIDVTVTDQSALAASEEKWLTEEGTYIHNQTFAFEEEADYTFNMSYTDLAGNQVVLSGTPEKLEDYYFMIDKTDSTISFDVKNDVVYNRDVQITLNVTDYKKDTTVENAVYSGLKSVEYEIRNNGAVTQSGDFNEELSNAKARVESLSKQITIDADEKNNSNNITVYVKAVDNAGNEATYVYGEGQNETPIKIDITKPTIDVSYDLNRAAVKNEKYFNADRTMTITYKERNINKEGLTFDFSTTENNYGRITLEKLGEIAAEAGIEISEGNDTEANKDVTARTDERTLTYTIKFTGGEGKDMDYHIVPYIEDQASNTNETVTYNVLPKAEGEPEETVAAPVDFTIDKTLPTMEITYAAVDDKDTEQAIDAATDSKVRPYKNQTIRATVKITERNFRLTGEEGTETTFTDEYPQVTPMFAWIQHDGTAGDVAAYENAAKAAGVWTVKTDEDGSQFWQQTFDFRADGDYSFALSYTDLAGNTTVNYPLHYYTVDKTAPTIDVVYTTEEGMEVTPGTAEADRLYYSGKKITARVTIDERNFKTEKEAETEEDTLENGQMKLVCEATNSETEVPKYEIAANTRINWKNEPTDESQYLRTQEFEFTVDANYTLSLTYKDLAGNECKYDPRYFTVDDTDPNGTITVTAQNQIYNTGDPQTLWSWEENLFNPDLYFGIFDKDQVTVTWETNDATAGVAAVGYYKYTPPVEARNEFQWLSYKQMSTLSDETDWIWTADINEGHIILAEEQQAIIYVKIVDRAGNVRYINTKEGIVIDDTEPDAPQIKITTAEPSQGIYNGNVNYQIEVVDPISGGTYSGLYDVHYEVTNNGQVTQSGTYAGELNNPAARTQSITKIEQVNAELNNSNHVRITVWATDYAGNTTQAYKDLAIDITPPQVWITYDLYNGLNGRYYNAVRTATVHVKERNFDTNAVDFAITNTDGVMPEISGWTIGASAGESDETENTCTVVFAADGDYTIAMNCKDKAGNASAAYQMQPDDDFTIDRTVPIIAVSYDNNNVANGSYYKAPRTATITVNEHNFNGSEVQTAIAAALQAQGITPPPVNGWTNNGDIHTATVFFSADGDYSFTVNYSDLAGNPAVEFVQSQFTIDQTKPTIEIFDIIDKSANNGVVAPGVNYSDVNYTPAGVSISIRGAKHEAAGLDGTRTNIANGESIKMADFAYEESVDDVYVLTAQVTDLAGNVEEKAVTFSVNRFGSNFIFSDETAAYLDRYYSNKEQKLVVTEINVDTLEHRNITYGLNGELVTLDEGTDYSVKESGSEVSWKSYQYTINAENFEAEGLYNVTIDSVDRATNEVNNKIKDANIEFVIDKTKPTVVITGIEDDGQYRTDARDIIIAVEDNVAMGGVDLYVDDETKAAASYDGEDIRDQKGKLPYTLQDATDWQYLKAVAVDAAGNEADTEQLRVLITANMLVQYYRNTPLLVGSIVILLAVAGGIIWFILAKRKKDKEKEEVK